MGSGVSAVEGEKLEDSPLGSASMQVSVSLVAVSQQKLHCHGVKSE